MIFIAMSFPNKLHLYRTSCVWFLITRVLVVRTKDGCPTTEQPHLLPLPSPKAQWEARDHLSWMQELEDGIPSITTFGNLIESKHRSDELFHLQKLSAWNARNDSLGHLLNLAVVMV